MPTWNDLDFLTDAAKKRNAHLVEENPKPKRQKYNNKVTVYDGVKYHSALEAKRAAQLDLLLKAGEIVFWCRQPQFVLGNGVTYKADFVVGYFDGRVEVSDVKGVETAEFKKTMKLLEKRFPEFVLHVIDKEGM